MNENGKTQKVLRINGKQIDDKVLTTETSLAIEKSFGMLLTKTDLDAFGKLEAILNGLPDTTIIEREIVSEGKRGRVKTVKRMEVGTIRRLMDVGKDLLIVVDSDKKKTVGITPLAQLLAK